MLDGSAPGAIWAVLSERGHLPLPRPQDGGGFLPVAGCVDNSFAKACLCQSMLYALQYDSHDQTGGYLPPVFFGRMLLELEAVGEGSPGVIGFFVLDLRKQGRTRSVSMGWAIRLVPMCASLYCFSGIELNTWRYSKSLNKL